MKHFWKTFLGRFIALCLVGCSIGYRNWDSTNDAKQCRDDPTVSWCAAMKHHCDLKQMETLCPKTCNLCPSQTSTDCASLNCKHSCSLDNNGSPMCVCNNGYELLQDGKTCEDINECERENPCPGDKYDCVNTEGSYRCEGRCASNQYKYYKSNKCCDSARGEVCGQNSENGGRRVNGAKDMVTRWPWMTLITFESSSNSCAGILVGSSWVLAAAHCVDGKKPQDVRLEFGIVSTDFKSHINDELQRRVADRIYIHPKFQHPHNDVALIKLKRDVELNEFVHPNCLPHGEDPVVSQKCWALGYASEVGRFAHLHRVLHQETVSVSKPEKCLGNSSKNGYHMMCISHENPELPEDCQGSTGGPLVCQRCSSCGWYVAGFASLKPSCRFREKSVSNFTKTSDHEVWIRETMGLAGLRSAMEPSCTPPRTFSDWSSWGSWSGCSVTCGNGTSYQRRICRGIDGSTNGCRGAEKRSRDCQRQPCKLDDSVNSGAALTTEWGEWSKCSTTCDEGTAFRFRSCAISNQRSKPCRGRERDVQKCNFKPCPKWSIWSQWEPCSVTCGRGSSVSRRSCLNGKEGDRGCIGRSVRARFCRKKNCPDWSSWSSWSSCSVSCGDGIRTSVRKCRLWQQSASGCMGNSTRTKTCQRRECEECREWTSWSKCSVTCGLGRQRRSRECISGSNQRTEIERPCRSASCPATWSEWSDWSRCSVSCGGGVKTRERRCSGIFQGRCTGSSTSTAPCNLFECPASDWSDWSSWNQCDVTCGTGLQTRQRKCKSERCAGQDRERKMCSRKSCIKHDKCDGYVDDWPRRYCTNVAYCSDARFWKYCGRTCCRGIRQQVYTKWSDWSSCSSTCGAGWQERQRSCLHPAWCKEFYREDVREVRACNRRSCFARESEPLCSVSCGGGLRQRSCLEGECSNGETLITEACNTEPCLNELSEWSQWTNCSASCGNGTRSRTRNCTGESCKNEILRQSEQCYLSDCGVWSAWKFTEPCSASCGLGSIKKKRTCLSDSCDGKGEEEELCVGSDCPTVPENSNCKDDPAMKNYCQLLKGNCNNGYMTYACRKSCGVCS